MSEDRTLPRPTGGPVLLDGSGGVKAVPTCSVCGAVIDDLLTDHHVCIPVEGGEPRKTTAGVARKEYEDSLPERTKKAEKDGKARLEAEKRKAQ